MNHQTDTHLLIIGAGLTGMSTALLLADAFPNWQITLLSDAPLATLEDTRTLVLLPSAYRQLTQIGITLDDAHTTTLHTTEVRLHGNGIPIEMRRQPTVVTASHLHNRLAERIQAHANITFAVKQVVAVHTDESRITCQDGEYMRADLCCLCAGSDRLAHCAQATKQHDYHANAWVFRCHAQKQAPHTAHIDIDEQGHIALLPAITPPYTTGVITRTNTHNAEQVADDIHTWLSTQGSELTQLHASYPLVKRVSLPLFDNHTLLLGHAAHQVHPIGAQGFNLTMRTIGLLVHALHTHNNTHAALNHYQETALADILRTLERTHLLATLGARSLLRMPLALVTRLGARFPTHASALVQRLIECE